MKTTILFLAGLLSFAAFAEDCDLDGMLKKLRNNLHDRYARVTVNEVANQQARKLKRERLDELAYMVKWRLSRPNQRGPWGMRGNTLVSGIKKKDLGKWMDKVG